MGKDVVRFRIGAGTRWHGFVNSTRYPFAALTASRDKLVFTALLARRLTVARHEVTRIYVKLGGGRPSVRSSQPGTSIPRSASTPST